MGDTAEVNMVKPSNKIVVDSTNIHIQTKKVETVAFVYPGRLVIQGTNDDDIAVCGSGGKAIGWAGYEHTAKKYRPATVDTIYTVNDQIAVVNGPGILIVGNLTKGQNVDKGTRLMADASGNLSGGTVGTHEIVAIAEQSVDATSADADIIVRSLI